MNPLFSLLYRFDYEAGSFVFDRRMLLLLQFLEASGHTLFLSGLVWSSLA